MIVLYTCLLYSNLRDQRKGFLGSGEWHADTWEGDDFEECLQAVYATRGQAKFDDENLFK